MNLTGILVVNKPVGITSFDCIRHIKKIVGKKEKIGHAGTLDPFASGVMIIAIGRDATRQLTQLTAANKRYIVTARLGQLTDTMDKTGQTITDEQAPCLTSSDLENAAHALMPSYEQVPPMYSSLKHKGQPLHKLARQEKLSTEALEEIVQDKAREVHIFDFALESFEPPFFSFSTTVSKGTYIRSLANDIAQKCGTVATCYELQRTEVGQFSLSQACNLHDLQTIDDISHALIHP